MKIWLTVKEAAQELSCSVQYIRYLIVGRNRKYPNRIKTENGVIPSNMVKLEGTKLKQKYLIHQHAINILKQIKNNKNNALI